MEQRIHRFIHNENDIKRFAEIFMPLSDKKLALCGYLTVRRKYYTNLKCNHIIMTRIIIPNCTDFIKRFYQTILRLETPVGSYTDEDIPDTAFALYIMIEPKDTFKALTRVLSKSVEILSDQEEIPNAYSLYREEIIKSDIKGKKYRQIDLDTKNIEQVKRVKSFFDELKIDIIICIETRGGFHIVCNDTSNKDINRKLHEFKLTTAFQKSNAEGKMITDYWFSVTNQPTVVLPGSYQGGFCARIISLEDWLSGLTTEDRLPSIIDGIKVKTENEEDKNRNQNSNNS